MSISDIIITACVSLFVVISASICFAYYKVKYKSPTYTVDRNRNGDIKDLNDIVKTDEFKLTNL